MAVLLALCLLQDTVSLGETLTWRPSGAGAELTVGAVPKDWTGIEAVRFRIRNPGVGKKTFVLRVRQEGRAHFWRRLSIRGRGWHEIRVPLYMFRREHGPQWSQVLRLVIESRQRGRFEIEDLRLPRGAGLLEPDADVIARGFSKQPQVYRNARFRIFSEVSIDGARLLSRLDRLWSEFSKLFPRRAGPEVPATLVIFRDRHKFVRFCERTADEIYGAKTGRISGKGYHVQDYAVSTWSKEWKEDRPMYIHEVAHALISRYLRLDVEQKWFQEGLATLFQVRLMPGPEQEKVVRAVRKIERRDLIALKYLDAKLPPLATEYLQYMTLIEFLFKRSATAPVLAAFQRGESLRKIVGDLSRFRKEWIRFCEEY